MYDDDDLYSCPHCGADLEASATFCRECGSDADTGWSEFADYAGLDLPDEAEDEFERRADAAPQSLWQQTSKVMAVLLIVAISGALFYAMLFYFAATS